MAKKKKQSDELSDEIDKQLSSLEKKLKKEYETAYKEVAEKASNYMSAFADRDAKKKADLLAGTISQEEYDKWRAGQILTGKRWEAMVTDLAKDLTMIDKKAASITDGFLPDAYALSFNFGTFEAEKGMNINTAFTLYSRETVEKLVADNPTLLPKPKVDIPKDQQWNKRHIKSALTQGVLQGDSLTQVADRLQQVTSMDARAAIRNARTMMTGVQNGARIDAYKRINDMGVKVKKRWVATLDTHTRVSHQEIDGETVALNKTFSNGLMYPGDATRGGDKPEEVYNCRCTIIADFPEYEKGEKFARYDNIEGKNIEYVTFRDWMKAKTEGAQLKEWVSEVLNIALPEVTFEELVKAQRQWVDGVYSKRYTEEDRQHIAEALASAPPEVRDFYAKYGDKLNPIIDDGRKKGGVYYSDTRQVHINGIKDIQGTYWQPPFSVSFHEIGHNMDDFSGIEGGLGDFLSRTYRDADGKSFTDIIFSDWDNYLRKRYYTDDYAESRYGRAFSEQLQTGGMGAEWFVRNTMNNWRRENGISRDDYEWIEMKRVFDRLVDYGYGDSAFFDFYMDNKDKFYGTVVGDIQNEKIPKHIIDQFCKDMRSEHSLMARGDLSDMFELYSVEHGGKDYPFGSGHGEDYFKYNRDKLPSEAFAEMSSATLANPESLDLIKECLPNAYEAYLDMLRRDLAR